MQCRMYSSGDTGFRSAHLLAWFIFLSPLLTGCPGDAKVTPESIEVDTIKVTGRVVDFETCFSVAGCKSVPNLIVSLYYNHLLQSDKTDVDGAYELTWVPDGINSYLIITEEAEKGEYLPTVQAKSLITQGVDISGLELFVLQRKGGLYAGIVEEADTHIETQALFIGQVFVAQTNSAMITFSGAQVTSTPTTALRYIKSNPRFPEQWGDTTTLHPPEQTTTTTIGSFLAIAPLNAGEVTFTVSGPNSTFPPITAPLSAGIIAIGLIEGSSGASTSGATGVTTNQ